MSDFDQRDPNARVDEELGRELERGRESCRRRAWADAYESLSLASRMTRLGGEDLELLAMSAYLTGRDADYLRILERAHHAYLDAGKCPHAVRCAFWLGLHLTLRQETGPGTGWLARAQRLLEREQRDCVEQGYLMLPAVLQHIDAGAWDAAHALATRAGEIGDCFAEADLVAASLYLQGRALIRSGQVSEGLAALDEAMIAVTADELSPLVTGLIYCSVIDLCQQVCALDRAREWTAALSAWCDEQPALVPFSGRCLVHRAEIMQLNGAWSEAIKEARLVGERFPQPSDHRAAAGAFYQEGEVHRLRGEFAAAEERYRTASRHGSEPQPGLALLRLAQGRTETAAGGIRRVMNATTDRLERARLLPAYVEIMLAADDIEAARSACDELEAIAETFDTGVLGAMAAHARGALSLASGDARAALGPLRHAFVTWQQAEAPYLAARVRVQIGLACRALDDADGAKFELDAARAVFEQLEAVPDLARIESFLKASPPGRRHGLTRRELQVLRLVASGKTNKTIAAELTVSEKTVDRHVGNIYCKLDVPSRAAATAFAYKHNLI